MRYIVVTTGTEKIKMRNLIFTALVCMLPLAGKSDGTAGDFDYYVMSLSWSPNWCALEGTAAGSPQCAEGAGFGWILHGLWPQYSTGWPAYCPSSYRPPTRQQIAPMADIMGTSGLAWHQWRKHGVCAGLDPASYYALSRDAYARVIRPAALRALDRKVTLPARLIEEAFLRDNPDLGPDAITVTCKSGHIQEVRICLTRDLEFRECGADVVRDCTLTDAVFEPVSD